MWEIAWYSDKGTRLVNEDRVHIEQLDRKACITVADGVGGHGGGSTAAAAVTLKMAELFQTLWAQPGVDAGFTENTGIEQLKRALAEVNDTVLTMQTPMCRLQATCVTLWLEEENGVCHALWANVGDSRLYLFTEGKLERKTQDHSLAELWKDQADQEEISRNIIWQAMGEPDGIKPDILRAELTKPAAFLLCSDGLWECVSETEMECTLAEARMPGEWLEKLRLLLKSSGRESYDNNSAAAVFIR